MAVVTGANKGIGFEVVKMLSKLGLTVVLTARNAKNGSIASDSLRRDGFQNVHFFWLDVSDPSSISAFVSWFLLNFGVLDILRRRPQPAAMAKKKTPKQPVPARKSPSPPPLKVSVPPIEDPVPEFDPATVLDLPSVSLGNTDCEVPLSPSLSTELDIHPALVSDAEPPYSETLATVSCDVPVVKEGSTVLAVQASAEKVAIVSSSVPEQSNSLVTSSAPDLTKAPSSSVEQAKSPAEIWKGFKLRNPSLRQTLESEELTYEQIDATVTQFLEDVSKGTYEENGWPENWSDYAVSKMALNAYSRVLARRYDGKKLSVNCYCPGFTRTSMTGGQGTHTAEEAAATIATLVLLPPEKLTSGKFFMCVEPNKIISRL
ncbi:hypothetical protein Bca52824_082471 [Brassica carinata]|uniref:Uncharacterized protein n=1 Tax=Brassica carinata TaxID=52824 RepID=A0A8X7PJ76_BRACI|nr:hypothetical protein Bca52824_082471 [Brassica carinata]